MIKIIYNIDFERPDDEKYTDYFIIYPYTKVERYDKEKYTLFLNKRKFLCLYDDFSYDVFENKAIYFKDKSYKLNKNNLFMTKTTQKKIEKFLRLYDLKHTLKQIENIKN